MSEPNESAPGAVAEVPAVIANGLKEFNNLLIHLGCTSTENIAPDLLTTISRRYREAVPGKEFKEELYYSVIHVPGPDGRVAIGVAFTEIDPVLWVRRNAPGGIVVFSKPISRETFDECKEPSRIIPA